MTEDTPGRAYEGAVATVHGAVSLINAIATEKGATLGIALKVKAEIKRQHAQSGSISIESAESGRSLSSRLVQDTIIHTLPEKIRDSHKIDVSISSEIPTGFGLKSSSAISTAVALACAKSFGLKMTDQQVLIAGVEASIASKVSITGAYDDACACYYGGFNVTDNRGRYIVRHERSPDGMSAVIFIPKSRKRGNVKKLKALAPIFEDAWKMARKAQYWKAMTINGLAAASALGSDAGILTELIENGALAASVSGNGPAIAAIAKDKDVRAIRKVFSGSSTEGSVTVSTLNNRKARIHGIL